MQKLKITGLSILSGLLMGISWPETGGIAPLFFIALLPLLWMEDFVSQDSNKLKSRHVFFNGYLALISFILASSINLPTSCNAITSLFIKCILL